MNHSITTQTSYTEVNETGSIHTFKSNLASHAHWGLRFAIAGVFIYHGIMKFTALQQFAAMMDLPYIAALLVAFAEVAGGLGIIAGGLLQNRNGDLITRLAGLAIIPVMLGAILMVHWGQWNFVPSESHPMGGMEFQVTLLLLALYFSIKGNRA